MAEDVPESTYFPHDRENLLNTIARFDNGLRAEDVVGPENEADNLKQYSNTVLIQVLLEFICHAFVKDENYREKLLLEACKRLSKLKILNDVLIMDKSNALRIKIKDEVINFLKQVCKEVIPTAELDTSAVHLFQNDCLSTELKLYYCVNFIELGQIGKGGFGSVYKAQYKLNKLMYAVKKIPFVYKTDGNFLMVMREANNFAALSHPNVVRYYSAWIEMSESDPMNKLPPGNADYALSFHENDITREYSGLVIKEKPLSGTLDYMSANDLEMYSSKSSESAVSDSIVFMEHPNDVNRNEETSSQSFCSDSDTKNDSDNEDDTENKNENSSLSNFKIQGVLYIQMEYCDCDLSFWLDKRAEANGKGLPFEMDVHEIFKNIVKGVAHIHSKNIIHRDLKPHNIFYSQSCNTVKIGDFGLATLSGYTDSFNDISHSHHSSCVGTLPYAAPEQRKSKNYDMKVDIYSLGVILIELINICKTRTELSHIIEAMKDGKMEEKSEKYPVLANLARVLISDDPNQRMSAKEILNVIDKDSKDILKEVVYNELVTEIKEKNEAIQSLKESLKAFDGRYKNLDCRYQKMGETFENLRKLMIQQNLEISRLNRKLSEIIIQPE